MVNFVKKVLLVLLAVTLLWSAEACGSTPGAEQPQQTAERP